MHSLALYGSVALCVILFTGIIYALDSYLP